MPRAPLLSLTALRVLAVTALSFSLLTACGKAEEVAEEAATEAAIKAATDADVDVNVEAGGQTVSGVDDQGRAFTTSQGAAAKIPADFPEDVLVPEGLVLDTAMVVGGSTFLGGTLTGDLADLATRIDAHMTGAGWSSLMAVTEPTSSALLWQRGDRSVSYMIEARPDGGLGVAISHTVEEKAPEAGTAP